VAREAAGKFELSQILFVPAANPPHKPESTAASYEHRYRMVELACEQNPLFVPSRLEAGPGKSYSILTIEKLRSRLAPADEIYFLIGADAFADITTWRRWRDVVKAVQFIVVTRPGHEYAMLPGATIHCLETVALPVSSSQIREKLAAGEAVTELPPAVMRYILENGLYR
jgi:nicotinate-nucleotide adenylyltransferase